MAMLIRFLTETNGQEQPFISDKYGAELAARPIHILILSHHRYDMEERANDARTIEGLA
jgi:hypothetical protein